MVDLDSTKLTPPTGGYDEISPLPEPEGTILKNHLKQVRKQEKAVAENQELGSSTKQDWLIHM